MMQRRARWRGPMLILSILTLSGCGQALSTGNPRETALGISGAEPSNNAAGQAVVFGMDGSSLWMVSKTEVSVSRDLGRGWALLPPPSGLDVESIEALITAPDRPLFIASLEGEGVHVFRWAEDGPWVDAMLVPTWPAIVKQYGAPDMVTMAVGPEGLISVTATVHVGMTSAFSSLFISTDDGLSFKERPPATASDTDTLWWAIAMASSSSGVLIAGPARQWLFHTSDGGTTWSPVPLGLDESDGYQLGDPTVNGLEIEVPVTVETTGGEAVSILVSNNSGQTFTKPSGSPLELPRYNPPVVADTLGPTTWVVGPDGGHVYVSADRGQTWASIDAPTLPPDILTINLSSSTDATAEIMSTSCTGSKSGCQDSRYLLSTIDGGKTWTAINVSVFPN
jgi:photosystem II stability/assembly factor-like uncharacterized protein